VIAAGGTGGHLYPAIAVARELAELAPGTAVTFVGRAGGLEERVVPREGFPFAAVECGPWRRGTPSSLLTGCLLAARGAFTARRIIRTAGASAVFSTGGFTSVPVLLAATASRVPFVLHEPNQLPGVVTRVFGRFAQKVTVGYADAAGRFPSSRTLVTGVPVRRELMGRATGEARAYLGVKEPACVVLALGGSKGAAAINRAMMEALPRLASGGVQVSVIWICGTGEEEACRRKAESAPVPVRLFGYLDSIADARGERSSRAIRSGSLGERSSRAIRSGSPVSMADALAAADVVVMRAGASSVAEVLALGKPSLLIPYPYAAEDHQTRNAEALAREGAAMLMPEKALTGAALAAALSALAADPGRRREMARRAAALGRPGAAREVASLVLAAMGGAKC